MGSTLWNWTQETGLEHLAITLSDPPRGPSCTPDQSDLRGWGEGRTFLQCPQSNPMSSQVENTTLRKQKEGLLSFQGSQICLLHSIKLD